MDYRDEDRWLFQTRIKPTKDHPPVWLLAAILIGWFLASVYAGKTDLEDAINVAQEEEEVHVKKLELATLPCATWICQKHFSHEPCGRNTNTACVASADLTRNQ